jgi:hypothetical protein
MEPNLRSMCCAAPVRVAGEGETHYHICNKCHDACDVFAIGLLPNNEKKLIPIFYRVPPRP